MHIENYNNAKEKLADEITKNTSVEHIVNKLADDKLKDFLERLNKEENPCCFTWCKIIQELSNCYERYKTNYYADKKNIRKSSIDNYEEVNKLVKKLIAALTPSTSEAFDNETEGYDFPEIEQTKIFIAEEADTLIDKCPDLKAILTDFEKHLENHISQLKNNSSIIFNSGLPVTNRDLDTAQHKHFCYDVLRIVDDLKKCDKSSLSQDYEIKEIELINICNTVLSLRNPVAHDNIKAIIKRHKNKAKPNT